MSDAGWCLTPTPGADGIRLTSTFCDGLNNTRRSIMRVAIYARVSTPHQAQTQTIEQQLSRLRSYIQEHGWTIDEAHIYRDEGYSGARLNRPGLDELRDRAAGAEIELVLLTAPDRLARRYIHQVLLIEELQQHGCQVQFID